MRPAYAGPALAALWQFERIGEPNLYRIRSVADPAWMLTTRAQLEQDVADESEVTWQVELSDVESDVQLFVLKAGENGGALSTGAAPPYTVLVASGTGEAGQQWRLTPYHDCSATPL